MALQEEVTTEVAEVAPAQQEAMEQLGRPPELTTQRYLDRIRSQRPESSEERFCSTFQSVMRETARQQTTERRDKSNNAAQASSFSAARGAVTSAGAGVAKAAHGVAAQAVGAPREALSTCLSGSLAGIQHDEQPQPMEPPPPNNAAQRWRLVRDEARGEHEVYMPLAVSHARSCPPPMRNPHL